MADNAVVISHSAQCLINFLEKCAAIENNLFCTLVLGFNNPRYGFRF